MKILYIDTAIDGHHLSYLNGLLNIKSNEYVLIGPYKDCHNIFSQNIVIYNYSFDLQKKSFRAYKRWIKFVKEVAFREKIEIIHFLDGDTIMKFFGSCIKQIEIPVIITYHHFFKGFMRRLSYKHMAKSVDKVVVHLNEFVNNLSLYGIKNVSLVNYPAFQFDVLNMLDSVKCKEKFRLPLDRIIISIIGTTSIYKGYFDLINVLSRTKLDYIHLFLVGRAGEIDKQQFEELLKSICCTYTLDIREINDDEYVKAVVASDIILLPYIAGFEGASGPLSDGASCKKTIIASSYSSIGRIVRSNDLGYVFGSLDELFELLKDNKKLLSHSYNGRASLFRDNLSPLIFQKSYFKIYSELHRPDEKNNC